MSVDEHHRTAPAHLACFVLTVSDTRTAENDRSGQAIVDLLGEDGHLVCGRSIVPDEPDQVTAHVCKVLDQGTADVVIATGGTGIAHRDRTFEAVAGLFEREMPGFGELFRMLSFEEIGAAAMLSRAAAGIVGRRVVFVLPGSERAVRLAMSRLILPELGHIVSELRR
jgi:molybdenum cofactor biosynthesis protein B